MVESDQQWRLGKAARYFAPSPHTKKSLRMLSRIWFWLVTRGSGSYKLESTAKQEAGRGIVMLAADQMLNGGGIAAAPVEVRAVRRKVAWRVLPLAFLLYIVAYLDRANVGFAKLRMASDLKFSEAGFFPGVIVYFTHWFASRDRARALSGLVMAVPFSLALGAPVIMLANLAGYFGNHLTGWLRSRLASENDCLLVLALCYLVGVFLSVS